MAFDIHHNNTAEENRKRWIEALRSGTYKQGQELLRTGGNGESDKFCCLGVACDMYAPGKWVYEKGGWYYTIAGRARHAMYMPRQISYYLGIHRMDEIAHHEKINNFANHHVSLVKLNDRGWTFEDIATLLENVNPRWITT